MFKKEKFEVLTGNQLKLIALVAMTLDHIGKELLPQVMILQIIGRLSFPVYAYMIAEGCFYTKNRRRYAVTMAGFALLCQAVYTTATGSWYMCVLVTFALSIGIICLFDMAMKRRDVIGWAIFAAAVGTVYFVCRRLGAFLPWRGFAIDYDFYGVMTPLLVYMARGKAGKLFMAAAAMILICLQYGGIQWWSLVGVALLALYSGKRGDKPMKWLFYVYYPLHLVAVYALSVIF